MTLPLSNINVLDFSHLLPGQMCATILADLGASVTRIDSPEPILGQKLPPVVKGESLFYWSLNRNKKHLVLNLKDAGDLEKARQLIKAADVIIENFRPGVMKRFGLDYDSVKSINKQIVYCSISAYGNDSAYGQRPGHDLNFQSETGLLNYLKQDDGEPIVPELHIAAYTSAVYSALAITAALMQKKNTGEGQYIDMSIWQCALSLLNIPATVSLYAQENNLTITGRGTDLPNYCVYKCKDGKYLTIAAVEPIFWRAVCERVGKPEWASYSENEKAKIKEDMAKIIAKRDLAEWLEIFKDSNCCVSPVNTLAEALQFLPAKERQVITHMANNTLGQVPQLKTPLPWSK